MNRGETPVKGLANNAAKQKAIIICGQRLVN